MPNSIVIPELEAELKSIHDDLRKVIVLLAKSIETNEAISAAILNLLDRVDTLEGKCATTLRDREVQEQGHAT